MQVSVGMPCSSHGSAANLKLSSLGAKKVLSEFKQEGTKTSER